MQCTRTVRKTLAPAPWDRGRMPPRDTPHSYYLIDQTSVFLPCKTCRVYCYCSSSHKILLAIHLHSAAPQLPYFVYETSWGKKKKPIECMHARMQQITDIHPPLVPAGCCDLGKKKKKNWTSTRTVQIIPVAIIYNSNKTHVIPVRNKPVN